MKVKEEEVVVKGLDKKKAKVQRVLRSRKFQSLYKRLRKRQAHKKMKKSLVWKMMRGLALNGRILRWRL